MDLSNFNTKNPKKLYEFNKFKFLYENCDTVIINGERFGNTQWEKLERFAMRLPDENGNPNIKTLEFDYKIGGLDFDERDFIDYEIENLNKVYDKLLERLNQSYQRTRNGTAPILYLPKRKEMYLNYLKSLKQPEDASAFEILYQLIADGKLYFEEAKTELDKKTLNWFYNGKLFKSQTELSRQIKKDLKVNFNFQPYFSATIYNGAKDLKKVEARSEIINKLRNSSNSEFFTKLISNSKSTT